MKYPLLRVSKQFWLVSALFLLASHLLLRFCCHELWKDEWQSWFVARDMPLLGMIKFLYYEGHPALWYVYLKPFTLLSEWVRDDILIKVAHLIPFMGFYFLVLSFKNIRIWVSLLFLLGYFTFFEYGLISRGYIFVCLALFILIKLYESRISGKNILLSMSLLLACQTEIYGLVGAGLIFLYYSFLKEEVTLDTFQLKVKEKSVLIPLVGLSLGIILFYITVNWAPDAMEVRGRLVNIMSSYDGKTGFEHAFNGIFGYTFFPFLNMSVFKDIGFTGLWSAIAIGLIILVLRSDRNLLLLFVVFSVIVLIFASTTYSGGMRQWGMVFIFFSVCVYIGRVKLLKPWSWSKMVFIGILCIQLLYNIVAATDTIRYPFTNARQAGLYIKNNLPPSAPIVGISPFNTAAPSGYADRQFFELPEGEPFTYFKWLDKVYFPPENELRLFAEFKNASILYVITHQPVDAKRYPSLRLVKAFDGFNLKNEQYYIYQLI